MPKKVLLRCFKSVFLFQLVFIFWDSQWVQASSTTCFKKKATRQVIILPPTGGANFVDRSLFDALCARGHQVTLLDYEQKSGISLDFGIHDRSSKEVLSVIDNQLAKTELPATLVGASLGGLYASMAFSYSRTQQTEYFHLKWIEKIVITVAGGPLADILTFSQAEQVRQQRELRLDRLGIKSLQEYKSALQKNIFYDPLTWAQPTLRSRVLMFNSLNDDVVPSKSQESLWKAWGKPETEWLSLGHQYSVGYVYLFYLEQMDRFLKKP